MKKKIFAILLAAALMAAAACGGDGGNMPYEPDTPEPPPHEGVFVSDHGTMEFNGDGETVKFSFDAELAGLTGLPEGEQKGTYTFLSGALPPHGSMPIRYDVAHELEIKAGSVTTVINVGVVENGVASTGTNCTTADRITFIYRNDAGSYGIDFIKSKD